MGFNSGFKGLKLYFASVVFRIMRFSPAHVDEDFTVAATFSGMR